MTVIKLRTKKDGTVFTHSFLSVLFLFLEVFMDSKLKEYRDKSFEIKMKIVLEPNLEKRKVLINEEKELLKEYRRYAFEL